jgi:ATP-dependent Lon protease
MTDKQPSLDFGSRELPEILSILPLFDATLFPKMVVPVVIMQRESIQLVDEAMSKDRTIGLILSKNSEVKSKYTPDDLYKFGTTALILKMAKIEDNRAQLLVQGLGRFKVKDFIKGKPYLQARVENLQEIEIKSKEIDALMANLIGLFTKVVEFSPGLSPDILSMAKSIQVPGILADMIVSIINSTLEEKQKVLETLNIKKRLQEVTRLVNYQLEILKLGSKIQSQVKGDMDKKQREYYLRQQMEAIKEELGEKDETSIEIEEYKAKIKEKNLPKEALKEAEREIGRLSRMHPSSSEYTVASTYLDWLTSRPGRAPT